MLSTTNPYAAGCCFYNTNWCNEAEEWLNTAIWVLIWEYLVRAIHWIPTWQGLDDFQKSLRPCHLEESSLSIGRVKEMHWLRARLGFQASSFMILASYCYCVILESNSITYLLKSYQWWTKTAMEIKKKYFPIVKEALLLSYVFFWQLFILPYFMYRLFKTISIRWIWNLDLEFRLSSLFLPG